MTVLKKLFQKPAQSANRPEANAPHADPTAAYPHAYPVNDFGPAGMPEQYPDVYQTPNAYGAPLPATTGTAPGEHELHNDTIDGPGYLTIHGVKKAYKKRTVVRGVSLTVGRGESIGLLGPNGAGKTTVFYMITGLVPADDGSITLDGVDVTRMPMYQRARLGIGYLPQEASIFRGLTVEQNIMAVLEIAEPDKDARREKLESLLQEFQIARLRKSPSIALSGGERPALRDRASACLQPLRSCSWMSLLPASIRSPSAIFRSLSAT